MTIQFVENVFVDSYYPTIENTFTKPISHQGQEYAAEIIDTAGQVRVYRGIVIVIISLDDPQTRFYLFSISFGEGLLIFTETQ